MNPSNSSQILPAGRALELLFDAAKWDALSVPLSLSESYAGSLRLPQKCLFANFVASLDGIVALPGDTESGQIISGRNPADRFVMGLLRAAADAVLLGAGTFRKSARRIARLSGSTCSEIE